MMSYSKTLKGAGLKCLVLPTPYAFHSSQVDTIMEPFEKLARSIAFQKPAIPVISPLLSGVVTLDEVFGPDYLASHARKTVNFEGALAAAKKENLVDENTIWIEIGPAPVCSSFVKSSLGTKITTAPSLRKKEDAWRTLTSSLSVLHRNGVSIDWNEMYRGYGSTHRVLALPRYSFDNKNYWIDYANNWQLTKGDLLEAPSKATMKVCSTSWDASAVLIGSISCLD
jgi:naphtho-gamma-pyrone polyketide synthase